MRPETPYKRALIALVTSIKQYISLLDIEMRRAPSHERGRRIGALTTALDMAADRARFFTLDIDYRTGKKRKSSATETSPNGAKQRKSSAVAETETIPSRRKSSATAETAMGRRKGFTASEMEIILGQARRDLIDEDIADNDANGTGEFLVPIFKGTATHPSKAPVRKKKARLASRDKT